MPSGSSAGSIGSSYWPARRSSMSEKDSPIAKYAPGLRSIKLYRDGRIEYRGHTGSVVGAAPGVDATGSKRLIRDTREVFLTIEGPSVGISAPLSSKGHLAQTQARKFAAKVNETAMQLGHAATARTTPSPSSPPRRTGTSSASSNASACSETQECSPRRSSKRRNPPSSDRRQRRNGVGREYRGTSRSVAVTYR